MDSFATFGTSIVPTRRRCWLAYSKGSNGQGPSDLSYLDEDLSAHKVTLPPKMFTERFDTVRYPYSVTKQKAYSEFGCSYEDLVMEYLAKAYGNKFETPNKRHSGRVKDLFPYLSAANLAEWAETIENSAQAVIDYFLEAYPADQILKMVPQLEWAMDVEAEGKKLTGHPDLVVFLSETEVVIFDVKVFARLTGKGKDSRFIREQISLYIMLARHNGLTCNLVGIIMPWCRDPPVKTYDVTKWKSELLIPVAKVSTIKYLNTPAHRDKWFDILEGYRVGSHLHKDDALKIAKLPEPRQRVLPPFQIFLYANNPSAEIEARERAKWRAVKPAISFQYSRAYVHAPYNLNFGKTLSYIAESAKTYLIDAARYQFRGVVFHVGHEEETTNGIEAMKSNIESLLDSVSDSAPFILETPCGNKNELLSTPEEFAKFVSQFPEHKVGICLDTCHVFVSGFLPMDYLKRLGPMADRVCLIHFNGSHKRQGAKADGHKHVTHIQNIPEDELVGILQWAQEWDVPCVTE